MLHSIPASLTVFSAVRIMLVFRPPNPDLEPVVPRLIRRLRDSFLPAALALGGVAAWAGAAEAPPATPFFSEGLDLTRPAQEAFADWPSDAIVERPYWLPLGPAALRRAALFDRPILFVVDVSWSRSSQRMLDDVLLDPAVLRITNAAYIAVRVNADRRPDVRERYQTGTWPVVALLLPNGDPMLSKANEAQVPRPITMGALDAEALRFLLGEGDVYWKSWPEELTRFGADWTEREGPARPRRGPVDFATSDAVTEWLLQNADRTDGGFGLAPKLVLPGLGAYARLRAARGRDDLTGQARLTIERLVASPLYDRRDGGTHRIALAPGFEQIQFEKMLEDNTNLLNELVTILRDDDSEALRAALAATARFLTGTLARPAGGFYLAQVADRSSDDGGGYWSASGDGAAAPPVDRLVLAGPNALAGAALLRAGVQLGDEALIVAGRAALDLVRDAGLVEGAAPLRHVLEPVPSTQIHLAAQADAALGFLDAYESCGESSYLEAAKAIADAALATLTDRTVPALFDRVPESAAPGLLANPRRPLLPNVRFARALLRLSLHGASKSYRAGALAILEYYSGSLATYRSHAIEAALAVEEALAEPLLVRIDGAPDDDATRALRMAALAAPEGWTVVTNGDPSAPTGARVSYGGGEYAARSPEQLVERLRQVTERAGS